MRRFLHFINEVGLGWLVAALFVVVLLFGVGYWLLAHTEPSHLVFSYDTDEVPGFGDSLYFSIVTISSLGYGDIRPVGSARLLVSLEVIVGLAFLGILIAKISSVKQDYILRRMYADLVDDKLEKYAHELEEQRTLYRTTSQLLLDGEIDPQLTTTFRRETPGTTFFTRFRQLLADVVDLMVYEASNNALFGVVDDSRVESVYDAVRGTLRRTTMLWERDEKAACDYVLCGNGPELEHICDLAERLATLGRRSSRNPDILSICDAIFGLCERIRAEVLPGV